MIYVNFPLARFIRETSKETLVWLQEELVRKTLVWVNVEYLE